MISNELDKYEVSELLTNEQEEILTDDNEDDIIDEITDEITDEILTEHILTESSSSVSNINIVKVTQFDKPTKANLERLIEEVKPYCSDEKNIIYLINLYRLLGYKLDPSQILFGCANINDSIMCLAGPGSGKTFILVIKIFMLKQFDKINGNEILCMAYNSFAVESLRNKQEKLIFDISNRISGVNLDVELRCNTFHVEAQKWVQTYGKELGFVDLRNWRKSLISEYNAELLISKILTKLELDLSPKKVLSYINYYRECLLTTTVGTATFEITDVMFNKILNRYQKTKELSGLLDFTDTLVLWNKLLDNEDFLERMRDNYKAIIVDEFQDCTPLIVDSLTKLNKAGIKLYVDGDDDQSIYEFRGANAENCLSFANLFVNPVVFQLPLNRRSKSNIVKYCNELRSHYDIVSNKDVIALNEGGSVKIKDYSSITMENLSLIDTISSLEGETFLVYRNKADSMCVALDLLKNEIPFNVVSGYAPYEDYLFKSLYSIICYIESPFSLNNALSSLNKLMPISDKESRQLLAKYDNYTMPTSIQDIDFGDLENRKGMSVCIHVIQDLINRNKTVKISELVLKILPYFKSFYWNYVKYENNFSDELENIILRLFNTEETINEFTERINKSKSCYESNKYKEEAIKVTTFHGVKGLECDNIILYNITETASTDTEKRILYVACSRPRNNLIIYKAKGKVLYSK